MSDKKKVIIVGASGRDFHNFNVFFRNNPDYEVVAFTQASGQNIGELSKLPTRKYPKELAGKLYPNGIQIYPEEQLTELIKKFKADEVVFAYSDITHEYVMHKASEVLAAGADFRLLGSDSTMLKSKKPVITICAVRTGCGKSPTTRKIARILKNAGKKVAIIRHPMPYGDLKKQAVQKFATLQDLDKNECTVEEREDYEPHIRNGFTVFAGVDYEKILREAEKEADVILWDGGNNDFSFLKADLYITVADAYRPGHELTYHPGETNFRLANVILINKVDDSNTEGVKIVENNARMFNPNAQVIKARSTNTMENPNIIKDKKVLVIEDGPTVTHGGMKFGAAYKVAIKFGAAEIIDPRPFAVGLIKDTFNKYTHLKNVLPAVGYGDQQIKDLQETINKSKCDLVLSGTPTSLERILKINKPLHQVYYEVEEIGKPTLEDIIKSFLKSQR